MAFANSASAQLCFQRQPKEPYPPSLDNVCQVALPSSSVRVKPVAWQIEYIMATMPLLSE